MKWLLIAVAVLLVIGISVGATLLFTRGSGGGGSTPTSGAASDIASANDTGPVSIITDEPTCDAFIGLNNALGDAQRNGWAESRGTLGPVSQWTPEQRQQVDAVATAIRNASDQMVGLAERTPHRVMRELYMQFIAFGRAYADSVVNYVPDDDALATANVNASSAIFGICRAIETGAANRSVAVNPADPPSGVGELHSGDSPGRLLATTGSPLWCNSWNQRVQQVTDDTAEWEKLDSSVPATDWAPDRKALELAAQGQLKAFAIDIDKLGRSSEDPILEDFTSTAAIYFKAYASIGDRYQSVDSWLSYVPFRITNLISSACAAPKE